MDLSEFLLARIAEDEAVAAPFRNDFGHVKHWRADETGHKVRQVEPTEFGLPDVISESVTHLHADHIARWDPARVLAECEAKRRIVALHEGAHSPGWCWADDAMCNILRALARPYASHPDFRPEWSTLADA